MLTNWRMIFQVNTALMAKLKLNSVSRVPFQHGNWQKQANLIFVLLLHTLSTAASNQKIFFIKKVQQIFGKKSELSLHLPGHIWKKFLNSEPVQMQMQMPTFSKSKSSAWWIFVIMELHHGRSLPFCGSCPINFIGNGRDCRSISCADDPCFNDVEWYDTDPGFQCGSCQSFNIVMDIYIIWWWNILPSDDLRRRTLLSRSRMYHRCWQKWVYLWRLSCWHDWRRYQLWSNYML